MEGEPQGDQQEEEERSCQGAFDLYFVLDKWVFGIIYGFVTFWSLRIAMQQQKHFFFFLSFFLFFWSPSASFPNVSLLCPKKVIY